MLIHILAHTGHSSEVIDIFAVYWPKQVIAPLERKGKYSVTMGLEGPELVCL